jgi:hypothetical protein
MRRRLYFKGRKYRNNKISTEGGVFDSMKEYRRYLELLGMVKNCEIADLRRQVKYLLLPAQREPDTKGPRGGVKKGKVIEHEVAYYADFVYKDLATGETVVEDTKGLKTHDYIIKRKMMLYFHGIRIREV